MAKIVGSRATRGSVPFHNRRLRAAGRQGTDLQETPMRENRLRTLWRQDQAAVNGWLAIPSSFAAEVMAHQGWDTLTIDLQHGVVD